MNLIEEYYVTVKYDGEYRTVDFEAPKYEDCYDFITTYAEDTFNSFDNTDAYNDVVWMDKNFCYWKIEKRFRLKQAK